MLRALRGNLPALILPEAERFRGRSGLTQELTTRTALSIGLNAAEAEATATGNTTRTATLNATLTHALTEDWALDAGYSYRWRDADSEGTATSDTLFLELRREFEWRP